MVLQQKFAWSDLKLLMNMAVIVAALGYFVDVYDMLLFAVVRTASLQDLGLSGEALTKAGIFLTNMQMGGMLLGGIFWGILGDKRGRLSVLFGSIIMYSLANIANAFVQDVNMYALCRLIAGIGLAGELGAGITLVAELLPKGKRGLGTTLVATVGVSGAVAAALVGELTDWRTAYIIGGAMGICLLLLRAAVSESHLFQKANKIKTLKRGRFIALFTDAKRFKPYLACILMGVPTWFVVGVLAMLSPEIAQKMGVVEPVKASYVVLAYSVMITLGDLAAGLLSQYFQTRKRIVIVFLGLLAATIALFFVLMPLTPMQIYLFYGAMGFFMGTWVLLVTVASELFGTNLRATVTSTVPNFVRGSTVLLNIAVGYFSFLGLVSAIQIVGVIVLTIALIEAISLPETFHRDLDFNEKI